MAHPSPDLFLLLIPGCCYLIPMNPKEKPSPKRVDEKDESSRGKDSDSSPPPKYEKPRVKSYAPLEDLTYLTLGGIPGSGLIVVVSGGGI
jgi:hypothetical protein